MNAADYHAGDMGVAVRMACLEAVAAQLDQNNEEGSSA